MRKLELTSGEWKRVGQTKSRIYSADGRTQIATMTLPRCNDGPSSLEEFEANATAVEMAPAMAQLCRSFESFLKTLPQGEETDGATGMLIVQTKAVISRLDRQKTEAKEKEERIRADLLASYDRCRS